MSTRHRPAGAPDPVAVAGPASPAADGDSGSGAVGARAGRRAAAVRSLRARGAALARRVSGWPFLPQSLRGRLMTIGVVGLAAGLAAGGVVLIFALGYALQRTVDSEAFKTADAVAILVGEDALPDPLPVAGSDV